MAGPRARSSFVPFRTSRSRSPDTGVSMVTTSAENPAALARCDGRARRVAAADEVQLIPGGPTGGALHILQSATGQGGEDVHRPSDPGLLRGDLFATRVEHPAAADRRQQDRHAHGHSQHSGPEMAVWNSHGASRPEGDRIEYAAVLTERHFAVGAAVDVVEDGTRQPALREASQVADVDHVGWGDSRHVGVVPPLAIRRGRRCVCCCAHEPRRM